ncbi:Fur family transcriptional regulator [Kocuria sp.]|uniref:Fur family transcriptional regulator n=1 Tax=Kocuria sp. TaxID=1871328 RepID=UPI0026E018F6|nr:Fur family transcriptional regulator [Kocuria sp.]MDO5619442.1 Fur family transcriptional regulator [Kocuria sp.]
MSTDTADHHPERTLLRHAGLRVTRPRVAVLSALRDHQHSDAATILEAVREQIPAVSHQAVYDCLHALTQAGLVRSLQPAGSSARYELRRHDNHHHLVCRGCSQLVDVPCSTGVAPCLHLEDNHGYLVDEAEIYYWGLCPDCRAENARATTATSSSRVT